MEPATCRREVVVELDEGLHFAPMRAISQAASHFDCEIAIHKEDRKVDAKSMFDLLTLFAEKGTHLVIEAHGSDALEAVTAILDLFSNGFQGTQGTAETAS